MSEINEGIKKLILAGIGAVTAGYEKSSEVVNELIKKGELTVEQGRVLNEELKHNFKEAVKDSVHIETLKVTPETIKGMSEDELTALENQIAAVRHERADKSPYTEDCPQFPEDEPVLVKEEIDTEVTEE